MELYYVVGFFSPVSIGVGWEIKPQGDTMRKIFCLIAVLFLMACSQPQKEDARSDFLDPERTGYYEFSYTMTTNQAAVGGIEVNGKRKKECTSATSGSTLSNHCILLLIEGDKVDMWTIPHMKDKRTSFSMYYRMPAFKNTPTITFGSVDSAVQIWIGDTLLSEVEAP